MGDLKPPELLTAAHDTAGFDCGKAALDRWLAEQALRNQASGDARCYVVCSGRRVIGYYALATASVERRAAARSVRRGAPDPIPAILLGRLAVDRQHAGQGIGSGLLKDAFLRAGQVSRLAGARLLVLDAVDEEARSFYLRHGFRPSPLNPLQLMHSLDLRGDLSSAEEGSQR